MNDGIFVVGSPSFPGVELIAKVPILDNTVDALARKAKMTDEILGSNAARFLGTTKINVNGSQRRALVFEKIDGVDGSSDSFELTDAVVDKVDEIVRSLLRKNIVPFDFQFILTSTGELKVIDTDMYVLKEDSAPLDMPLSYDGETVRLGDFLVERVESYFPKINRSNSRMSEVGKTKLREIEQLVNVEQLKALQLSP